MLQYHPQEKMKCLYSREQIFTLQQIESVDLKEANDGQWFSKQEDSILLQLTLNSKYKSK
jgi:hypothetical protein